MESVTFPSPHFTGNTLTVQIDGRPFGRLGATIVKPFEPFTLSCASLVQLDWPSLKLKGQYVLKLFDRRFAAQLRRDCKAFPSTLETEDEYRDFVKSGSVEATFALCAERETDDEWTPMAQKNWNRAQLEAYLQYSCRKFYLTETTVYNRLHELQGQDVPQFVARLLMRSSSSTVPTSEYLDCPGFLLEYVQGFSLTDIDKFAPKAAWQQICDEAIRIINLIGDLDIRNEDVKTRSFIVRTDPDTAQFKVVMMDFASCVLRQPNQGDQDWREWKAMQDEEGAIGLVMERKLKSDFRYTRSAVSRRLMAEFQSE